MTRIPPGRDRIVQRGPGGGWPLWVDVVFFVCAFALVAGVSAWVLL